MRLSGQACVNLTATDCTSINGWALAHGTGGTEDKNKLVAGLYQVRLDTATTPTFTLRLSGGKGGVHIQFWTGFIAFLTSLRADVLRSPAPRNERDAAVADLDLLQTELQRGGFMQGSWLSEMRNAVNYRFEHGSWFPYDSQEIDADALSTSFRVHAQQAGRFSTGSAASPELVRAARVCGYLVGWLRNSVEMISSYSKGEKDSLSQGALAFAKRI